MRDRPPCSTPPPAPPGDPYAAAPPARPFLQEVGAAPGRLRIAWTAASPNGALVEAEPLRVLRETARLCADLGHQVQEADPVVDGAAVVPTFLTLAAANTVVNLNSHPTAGRAPRPGEVEKVTYATGQKGERISAADYVRATQTAHGSAASSPPSTPTGRALTPGLAMVPPSSGGSYDAGRLDEYWRRVFRFSPFTVVNLAASRDDAAAGTSPDGLPARAVAAATATRPRSSASRPSGGSTAVDRPSSSGRG